MEITKNRNNEEKYQFTCHTSEKKCLDPILLSAEAELCETPAFASSFPLTASWMHNHIMRWGLNNLDIRLAAQGPSR